MTKRKVYNCFSSLCSWLYSPPPLYSCCFSSFATFAQAIVKRQAKKSRPVLKISHFSLFSLLNICLLTSDILSLWLSLSDIGRWSPLLKSTETTESPEGRKDGRRAQLPSSSPTQISLFDIPLLFFMSFSISVSCFCGFCSNRILLYFPLSISVLVYRCPLSSPNRGSPPILQMAFWLLLFVSNVKKHISGHN